MADVVRSEASCIDSIPLYVKELIAGGAAGGLAKTAVAPLERTKILLQTRTHGFHSMGMLKAIREVKKHEGISGFYKGNGASVLRIVPYAALHFMTYERYRSFILENHSSWCTGPVVDLLAGSLAGGTAVICTYPLDLARTKMAYQISSANTSAGIKDVFSSVYKSSGARGLYRGIGPTMAGILPYAGLKFYIYEELRTRVSEKKRNSIAVGLSCGALAGLFGQTVTYPLDVVRRQMQAECWSVSGGCGARKGTVDGLRSIVRRQGWKQLFAGLSINYVKIVPSVAIGFAMYDCMKTWLRIPPRHHTSPS